MKSFGSFSGMITMINDFFTGDDQNRGCYKLISVVDENGNIVNFVVSPTTYFVDHVTVKVGDLVTGYYDANAPVPAIFPPQYQALVMNINSPFQNVKVDFFDSNLVSSDGTLKLNVAPFTPILLENDQLFTQSIANRNLIVVYGPTTKSIPAQTTPYKIIVMCP